MTYTLGDIGNAPGQAYDWAKRQFMSLTKPSENDGDYTTRSADIARQQKLAEMLSQMGAQEQAVSTAGGITAPMSGMGALARGLTSFGGSYLSGKAAADEAALKKASLADALAYFSPSHDVNIPGASTDVTLDMSTPGNAMASALKGSVNPEDLQGPMNAPSVNPEDLQAGPTPDQNPRGLKMPDISSAPQKYTLDVGPSTGTATYSPEEQMARARAAQFNSNPLIRSAAAGEMARLKPEYVAGSEYGTNRINPDGTINQVIAPIGKPVRSVRPATAKDLIGYEPGTSAQVFEDTNELTNIQRPYHDTSPHVSVKVEDKGADAYVTEVGKLNAARQNAIYDAGRSAPQQIETAQRVKSILMGPNVMTGTAADIKLAFGKAFYGNTASVNDTQTLITDLSKGTLAAIKTSGLGTSQGFTDKDLEFLRAATTGTINFTKDTLFRLADLSERAARASAEKGNGVLKFWKSNPDLVRSGVMDDPINVPPPFVLKAPPNAGAPASEGKHG